MRMVFPLSESVTDCTAESGARSDKMDWVRRRPALGTMCGGEEERIPVVDVGIGEGYFRYASSWCEGECLACRLAGRGSAGEEEDEEEGSKAGSRDGAGRFTPAAEEVFACMLILLGEESIFAFQRTEGSKQVSR